MPKFQKLLLCLLPALLMLSAQPGAAQNRGRTSVTVRGSSAGARPATQRVSMPQQRISAPRTSAPSRNNYRPQVSAPRANTYRSPSVPLTRSSVTVPGRTTNTTTYRPGNRGNAIPRATNTAVRSNSVGAPRAAYPGRINTSTTARVYSAPPSVPGRLSNGQVRSYVPGQANNVRRNPAYNAPTAVTTRGTTRQVNGVGGTGPGGVGGIGPGGTYVNRPNSATGGRTAVTVRGYQPVPTQTVYNNYNYYNNNGYSNRNNCAPGYNNWGYNNSFYSDYNWRRGYRYYQPCAIPFLSLGFFAARPYSYYDYARIDYAQPFVYGDDSDYIAAPTVSNEVASTVATPPPSLEQDLLTEIARYVDTNSTDQRFRIADPAFGNQVWNLDLTQAPAIYSIDTNHYSVISGFEGTLGENTIPSSVGLEFFVARENGRWNVKDAWIVSANGIPRAKLFQSPSFSQVQTWQQGEMCPFTGKPMIPISQSGALKG